MISDSSNRLYEEIKDNLKSYLQENSKYAPTVMSFPLGTKLPRVIIEEMSDNNIGRDMGNRNNYTSFEYEINIYAEPLNIDNKTISSRTVAKEIQSWVREFMEVKLPFEKTFNSPTPNIDENVYRITLRYMIKLDETRNLLL